MWAAVVSVSFINNTKYELARTLVATFQRLSMQAVHRAKLALWPLLIHKPALNLNAAATTAYASAGSNSRDRRVSSSTPVPLREKPPFCRADPTAFRSFYGPSFLLTDVARPGIFSAGTARRMGGRFVVRVNVHPENPACGETPAAKGWSGVNAMSDARLME